LDKSDEGVEMKEGLKNILVAATFTLLILSHIPARDVTEHFFGVGDFYSLIGYSIWFVYTVLAGLAAVSLIIKAQGKSVFATWKNLPHAIAPRRR